MVEEGAAVFHVVMHGFPLPWVYLQWLAIEGLTESPQLHFTGRVLLLVIGKLVVIVLLDLISQPMVFDEFIELLRQHPIPFSCCFWIRYFLCFFWIRSYFAIRAYECALLWPLHRLHLVCAIHPPRKHLPGDGLAIC